MSKETLQKFGDEHHETEGLEEMLAGLGYGARKEGALIYIVDSTGNKLSSGYHDFKLFKKRVGDTEITALIGELGGMKSLLKMPENPGDFFEEMKTKFHELEINDELGLILVKTGALKKILDPNTGKAMGKGYHDFFWREGRLYGVLGSSVEEVAIERRKRLDEARNELTE